MTEENEDMYDEENEDMYAEDDNHFGCPAYPMCDEAPQGCIHEVGVANVEWYGHRG